MKKRILALTLTAALLANLAACGAPGATTAASTESGGAAETTAAPAATEAPALQTPQSPAASLLGDMTPLYNTTLVPNAPAVNVEADFSNVINSEDISYWGDEAKAMLLQNGFVVFNHNSSEFFSLYEMNRYSYEPNYVTVDSLLHTYHLYFLYLQRHVEETALLPALETLTDTMLTASKAQLDTLTGTEWESAAQRNVNYFAVAAALLHPESSSTPINDTVAQELALIDEAAGIAPSPVMNLGSDADLNEDYSQYTPRSYYTQSDDLTRYFKAMMWYGRLAFLQSDADMTRSALLMNLALRDSGAADAWQDIYTATSFFAGAADDASYTDYAPLVEASYGAWPAVADLPNAADGWAAFTAGLSTLRPAAVNSMPIYEWENRDTATAGFRFMGQRYTLDAEVFQKLVYRDVEEAADGSRRMLPDALDLPAALGSDTALSILEQEGSTAYPNYSDNMAALRSQLQAAPESTWNASLYAGWLNMLRPLTEAKGEGYPTFMQNEAWATRNLSTMLGSWTELKHDTALYSKQVYAEMGGGPIPEADDRGYVEAEPVVFGRLAALAQATANGLETLGYLDDTGREGMERLAELARQLMVIAEKELTGELPTDEEFELIRSYGGQLEHFWIEVMEATGGDTAMLTPEEHPSALVADVATDPNGSVLQVGTGGAATIYVIVNVEGTLRLASGTVYSFYQFEQPLDQRLTDPEWWVMLGIQPDENGDWHMDTKPDSPAWTASYLRTNP